MAKKPEPRRDRVGVTPLATATEPPMSEAEYEASLRALESARAALEQAFIVSQIYPRWAYHPTEPDQLVSSDAEALALGSGWSASPITAPVRAVVTALEPNTAVLGAPAFTLHVIGSGFGLDAVILWNGEEEPTTVVSDTELTTGVDMSTAEVAITLPVSVTQAGGAESNALPFTLVAPAARKGKS